MKAVIFAGGPIEDYSYIESVDFSNCLLICADGGYEHTLRLGAVPNIIIGDGDSSTCEYKSGIERIDCPAEKDYTDTERCIDYAIEKGCSTIDIYGGLGGRIDHEFSNFCLMAYALKRNVKVKLINEHNEIWMEKSPFEMRRGKKKYVSFFPYGESVEKFSVHGLKYEADEITLECSMAQASSNEFADSDIAYVGFASGTLIVMCCDDAKKHK